MGSLRNIHYFPWLPGIPQQISNYNTIKTILDADSWNKILENRNPVITCFGGLFESYFSLSFAEAFNKLYPSKKIFINYNKFNELIKLNNIAKPINLISTETIKKYPVPLFFNDGYEVFFNSLYNYLNIKDLAQKYKPFKNYHPISKQIFKNSFLNWDINFIPKLRKLILPNEFIKWKEIKKFNINKPYVLILPDKTNMSIHSFSALSWSIAQVKSFVSMCAGSGINSVIITNTPGKYTGINSLILSPNLEQILCLIEKCSYILSEEIDFLLISLLLSKNSTIFSRLHKHQYSIKYNQNFLKTDQKIIENKILDPFEVYKVIR